MIKTKFNFILVVSISLFLAVSAFGAYQYFNSSEKNAEAVKEDIDVEIINGERSLAEKSPEEEIEKEIEEEVIESDAEQVEVNDGKEEEIAETTEPEEEAVEVLPVIPTILSAPSKKRNNPDELRIGFITDLHVRSGSDSAGNRNLGSDFVKKINYFVEKMNNVFVPNFVIANGDNIEGTGVSYDKGMSELSLLKDLFNRTTLKKYWVVGNHDLRSVTKKQFMQSLDIDYVSKAFEVGNYKIIILDSNFSKDDADVVPGKGYTRGHISEKQIKFLEKELKNTDKRTLVFLYHPPLWSIDGKYNFQFPNNAKRLQEIFFQNKVFAVFAGHIEDLFLQEIDGVKYFISPGIVKNEKYQGTFSEITIKKDKMVVDMSYLKNDGSYRTIRIKED